MCPRALYCLDMAVVAPGWDPEQVWLWVDSALAALLVHLVPAALLVLFIHWSPRLPPLPGSPAALNVELTAMPSATSPGASSSGQGLSQSRTRQGPAGLAALGSVRPLGQMHSIPQPEVVDSNAAPLVNTGATGAPLESSELGASGASDPDLQLWEDELVARLASYKEYPSSALQQMQQDTVTLQISVDHAGQVTHSRVDSAHHYPALEQEVQHMLRLAGTLPAPPPQLSADAVVTVPIQFSLDLMPNILCGGSDCPATPDAKSKVKTVVKAVAPPAPTLASCTAAASPGPAPAGATATLEQMRAYREQLNQYLTAAGNQLACLSQVREVSTLAMRDTLTGQLKSMVNEFNAAARAFEAKAQAQAQQAQQARQRQAQALAAQAYATCKLPTAPPAPGLALTVDSAPSYGRQLAAYQSAVRSYVACVRQVRLPSLPHCGSSFVGRCTDLADRTPGLTSDQLDQLHIGVQLANAAIQSFNQLARRFNAQVPHLRQALAAEAQQNLTEAVVRGTAIFPSSSWDLPVPLPADECVHITQLGQSYRASLCNPTYVTTVNDLSQQLKNNVNAPYLTPGESATKAAVDRAADTLSGLPAEALQQEAIAAQHGFPVDADPKCASQYCPPPVLGIAVTTQTGFANQVQAAGSRQQTISYSVSELQVAGRRVSMTITRSSNQDADTDNASAVHFDLLLSPDNQTLHGYCWMGQQRRACTLTRHLSASGPENPHH